MTKHIETMGWISLLTELVTLLGPSVPIPTSDLAEDMELSEEQVRDTIYRAQGKGWVFIWVKNEGVHLSRPSWLRSKTCYKRPIHVYVRARKEHERLRQ